jgi:nucleotide-binding universal stress UspA family protein
VCVTGVGAGDTQGHGGFLSDRILYPLFTKGIYADKEQEALIRDSAADWTIVRPAPFRNRTPIAEADCGTCPYWEFQSPLEGSDYAKGLATQIGASLHLVHVFKDPFAAAASVPEVYGVPQVTHERVLEDVHQRLLERLDADEERRFRGTRAVVTGLTASQIVTYAADQQIDLIVMGTHGRRGVAHLLLGSVAEHVVRTARCPVLTVRAEHGATEHAAEPVATAATAAV